VNSANRDFRLKSPLTGYLGLALADTYNIDFLGNTRGADGVWDRGAFEYGTTGIRRMENEISVKLPMINDKLKSSSVKIYDVHGKAVLNTAIYQSNPLWLWPVPDGVYCVEINNHLYKVVVVGHKGVL
jgi:hypothetical protein